jgi:hypothetical protein
LKRHHEFHRQAVGNHRQCLLIVLLARPHCARVADLAIDFPLLAESRRVAYPLRSSCCARTSRPGQQPPDHAAVAVGEIAKKRMRAIPTVHCIDRALLDEGIARPNRLAASLRTRSIVFQ